MDLINTLMIRGVILAASVPKVPGESVSEGRTTEFGGLTTPQAPISNYSGEAEKEVSKLDVLLRESLELATSSESPEVTSSPNSATSSSSSPTEACPDIGGPQVAGSVVKCYCQGNEIFEDGICKPYDWNTVVPVEEDSIYTEKRNTTNYKVTVRDVSCDSDKYISLNFTKGQFHLRIRGDVVLLKKAGYLEGQRINKYCLIHHLDSIGDLTWTMKACVPVPSVPRCCPYGQAMKDGSCQPARTPRLLQPPIAAKPFSDSVAWSNITNYINPLKCESESMTTIALNYKESNLVSLADGLANGWAPVGRRLYYKCPEYCVDGIENDDGSTSYFTSFCYSDPIKEHEKACKDRTCIHKCCKNGYSMDVNRYSCVPDSNYTFGIPTKTDLSNVNIVIGWPLCMPVTKAEGEINVNMDGSLNLQDRVISNTDYCVDTFINNDLRDQSALYCIDYDTSTWLEVRPVLFPICQVISLMFLISTILHHLWTPGLIVNGGIHLFEYAISLCIAYSASVAIHVSSESSSDDTCFITAIAMQFGYLSTYFWLSIICFGTWRETRSLKNNWTTKSNRYSVWAALYGWGIPFCISVITVAMQNLAPDNVYGIINPHIGVSRCWFKEDMALLVYFYGPTAIVILSSFLLLVAIHCDYVKVTRSCKDSSETAKSVKGRDEIVQEKKIPTRDLDRVECLSRKLYLITFVVICWSTEVLSWKVTPLELWALTDTLNCLQGIFAFLIMLSDGTRTSPKSFLKLGKKILGKLRGVSLRYNVTSSDSTIKGNQPAV